jgi:hypothetical protein
MNTDEVMRRKRSELARLREEVNALRVVIAPVNEDDDGLNIHKLEAGGASLTVH